MSPVTVRFTAREREAVIDALNRVLAGEYDGELPLHFYEDALDKMFKKGERT